MLEYYNQFLKTFKVRLKIDWILGLDYFWVWISKNFSEILLLLFDFYWYKLLWIWTLYYVYSISMCTNSKCTTLSAARKLVYFEGLLYSIHTYILSCNYQSEFKVYYKKKPLWHYVSLITVQDFLSIFIKVT